jgi:cell division protein FtsB
MAQNRRHQAASVRFGPAVAVVLICLLLGGSGVGYVWQKSQIKDLGDARKKREQRLAELQLNNEKLRRQLALLRSPAFLDRRVRELNLGLVPPQPSQVLRLPEPVNVLPPEPPAAQFADHPPRAG